VKRALLVSTNGTGMGHLTRSMAIARRLKETKPVLLTMSSAVGVAAEQGFLCEHFPSPEAPSPGGPLQWEDRFQRRLRELFETYEPSVVVFDGVNPYWGLLAALPRARARKVWVRRAMWQPGAGERRLALAAAFDEVVEPGELAASEDRGATAAVRDEATVVPPVTLLAAEEILPRERAAAELGLDPARPAALIQLGAGGPEIDEIASRCAERMRLESDLQVAVLESAISGSLRLPGDVKVLKATYPMSRFYRAFDLAVSAAGYNAFHELFAAGVPTLWVPRPRELDDQRARAAWAAGAGAGLAWDESSGEKLERAIESLIDPGGREWITNRLATIVVGDGAAEAAAAIEGPAA
jgi:UDP:flavonoid glycosyltransferase YjiC (YdhE family)